VVEGADRIGHAGYQIVDFLKANELQVTETVRGDEPNAQRILDISARQEELQQREPLSAEEREESRQLAREEAELVRNLSPTPAKFGQHTLPGGDQYRELLITLPAKPSRSVFRVINASKNAILAKFDTRAEAERFMDSRSDWESLQVSEKEDVPARDTFTGGHFDEPNVLVHLRFNDRIDADGSRVLFIEEIQSDWHQKGRKQGYRPEKEKRLADLVAKRDALKPAVTAEDEEAYHNLQHEIQMLGKGDVGSSGRSLQDHLAGTRS